MSWFKKWPFVWSQAGPEAAVEAEKAVFSLSKTPCTYSDTKVGAKKDDVMHAVSAGSKGPHVVCMPGYGSGAGFFYRNMHGLAQHCRVHVVDWLGTGLSGRPRFPCRDRESSEAWFVESLEKWRAENGVEEPMVLVGHSLGGYLSSAYAMKYPERVAHLVLVCPAGMSAKPDDYKPPEAVRSPWSVSGLMYRVAKGAWHLGVTPGVLVRTMGSPSRRLTLGYAERRLKGSMGLPEEEVAALEPYIYQILGQKGSGEFALRHILSPFAWAYAPMESRLPEGYKGGLTYIYGENDWMDPAGAERICQQRSARASSSPQTAAEPRAPQNGDDPLHAMGVHNDSVLFIKDAGHFVFLEQPQEFNTLLLEAIQHVVRDEQAPSRERLAAERAVKYHGADDRKESVNLEDVATTVAEL